MRCYICDYCENTSKKQTHFWNGELRENKVANSYNGPICSNCSLESYNANNEFFFHQNAELGEDEFLVPFEFDEIYEDEIQEPEDVETDS